MTVTTIAASHEYGFSRSSTVLSRRRTTAGRDRRPSSPSGGRTGSSPPAAGAAGAVDVSASAVAAGITPRS
ncbi:hypothetical protein Sya03_01390 [Spirilliplanes yamanashiensis]|uniref:Uncharacterized protein n=1 Tax=Spirilliplanes yamanashiensis TaxID=42233 RepID=A0A8J3Y3D3_9ACTN|nr:hypothetical protein Sya03_01390 [Spirilliplanes yamanashiensis]